jgi:hypothetical protein
VRIAPVAVLLATVVAGCASGGSVAPDSGSAASPAAGSEGASPPPGVTSPSPTPWPGRTVDAVLLLAVADGEIAKAGADLQRAAETEDLALMRRAAIGLAELIEVNTANVDRIEAYPPFASVAAQYRASFPVLLEAARQVSRSIDSGDASAIADGFRQLLEGLRLYGEVRGEIGELALRALDMKRLLVR